MTESWRKYLPLTKKKGRSEARKFIVEGLRLCREALLSDWKIEAAYVTEEFQRGDHWNEFEEYFRQRGLSYRTIGKQNLRKLADTTTPQGILLIMEEKYPDLERVNLGNKKFILVLQSVRDPGNLGTLVRTADWFGVDLILLSDDCVEPFNPKVIRATMGSIFHFPVLEIDHLQERLKILKKNRFFTLGASLHARKTLNQIRLQKPVALVLGGEAQGLSIEIEKQLDLLVRIWKFGQAESLNVAVAGGIFMNHIANQIFNRKRD